MEKWQFLIQKQGERVWQPLESLNQEIPEGRYRIVARSARLNTDVEIRVAHVSNASNPLTQPPIRRVHKRSRRTNHEGLLAVIPFTYFQPGLWEICCSGSLITDVMGTPWQQMITLKVQTNSSDVNRVPVVDQVSPIAAVTPRKVSVLPIPPAPPIVPQISSTDSSTDSSALNQENDVVREITDKVVAEHVSDFSTHGGRLEQSQLPENSPNVQNLQKTRLGDTPFPSEEVAMMEMGKVVDFQGGGESSDKEEVIEALLSLNEPIGVEEDGLEGADRNSVSADVSNGDISFTSVFEVNRAAGGGANLESMTLDSDGNNYNVDRIVVNEIDLSQENGLVDNISIASLSSPPPENTSDGQDDGIINGNGAENVVSHPQVELAEHQSLVDITSSLKAQINAESSPQVGDLTISAVNSTPIDSTGVSAIQINSAEILNQFDAMIYRVADGGDLSAEVIPHPVVLSEENPIPADLIQVNLNTGDIANHENVDLLGENLDAQGDKTQVNWDELSDSDNSINCTEDIVGDSPTPQTIKTDSESSTTRFNFKQESREDVNTPEITPIAIADDDLPVAIVLRNDAIAHQSAPAPWVHGNSAEDILKSLLDLALPNPEPLFTEETTTDDCATPQVSLPLIVNLESQNYISPWGVPLTIAGNVEINPKYGQTDSTNTSRPYYQHVSNVEVRLDVRSPQQLEVLTTVQVSLGTEEIVPFPIVVNCQIPIDCESKLLLADIYIYGALDGIGEPTLLGSQSFTITADISALLAIGAAAKPSAPDMLDCLSLATTPPLSQPATSSIDLELFNLVKTTKPGQTLNITRSQTKKSPKITLPPIIKTDNYRQATNRAIASQTDTIELTQSVSQTTTRNSTSTLPFLRKIPSSKSSLNSQVEANIAAIIDSSFPDLAEFDINGEFEAIAVEQNPAENASLETINTQHTQSESEEIPEISPIRKLEVTEEFTAIEPIGVETEEITLNPGKTVSTEEETIQAPLELSFDRSMSPLIRQWVATQNEKITFSDTDSPSVNWRLSPVTDPSNNPTNSHTPTVVGARIQENIPGSIPTPPPLVYPSLQQQPPRSWMTREIIVDDEPFDLPNTNQNNLPNPNQQPELEIPENLPIPIIHLLPGDLVAGHVIRLRVELPQSHPQVAIKLWMEDCQTRSLLDGPHLLNALLPNNKGGAETIAEMSIPFGCIEVQIGAIAIHLLSQQESRKATIQRSVVPPDLPNLGIDQMYGM